MNAYEPGRPACRCGGTGTATAVIPLADAVVLSDRACPAGCPVPAAPVGTPKRGYECNRCLDWRTVTVVIPVSDGVTSVREIACPECIPAAAAVAPQ